MFEPKVIKTILALSILVNILLAMRLRKDDPVAETAISPYTSQQIESVLNDFSELEIAFYNRMASKGATHAQMPVYAAQLNKLDSITNTYLTLDASRQVYQNPDALLDAKLHITKQLSAPFGIPSNVLDSMLYAYKNEQTLFNPTEARLQLLLTRYVAINYSRRGWNICESIAVGENIVFDSTIIVFFPIDGLYSAPEGDSLQIAAVFLGDEALPVSRCKNYKNATFPVIKIEAPARLIQDNELLLIKFIPYLNGHANEPLFGKYLLHVDE